jgi:hypothetical protein
LSQEILVDPSANKPPIKVWLLLGLAVLVLHLAALRALPMHLVSLPSQPIPWTFETRTLINELPAAVSPKTAPSQERIRQATRQPKSEAAEDGRPPVTNAAQESPAALSDTSVPDSANTLTETDAPMPEAAPEPPPPTVSPRQFREAAVKLSAEVIPASIKLVYEVQTNKFPYSLNGELVWISTNVGYEASLMFGAFGQKRIQTSRGQIGPEGLMPERFADKFRSELAAHFNRQQGKVTFSANTPDAPLLAGAQDRLSVLIQLAALVTSSPARYTPATTLTIQTVGPRDADLWLFTVGGTDTLTLPGGALEVLKLTRNPRQAYDQQVDIWLAPSLGYLPARIHITESNGDNVDLKWLRSEPAQPS